MKFYLRVSLYEPECLMGVSGFLLGTDLSRFMRVLKKKKKERKEEKKRLD